jgi:uncharacterized phage infection (PIP) family protein YhgE
MASRAQPTDFLTPFNNAIGRLNGLTTTAQNDSARLNLERQNFIRDATGGLATMSQAVATLRIRVTAYVAELARLRNEVSDNDATIARNLAIIDRLNGELDALRQQGPGVAPGSPAINNRYADIQMLEGQIQELKTQNGVLEKSMRDATPVLVRIEEVFAQINANPIPTGPLLDEITRLNVEIQAILALLPALPGSGSVAPPGAGSGSGGFFGNLFGNRQSSAPPASSYLAPNLPAQQPGVTPASFFPTGLNNQLRGRSQSFGGKRGKKGGYIYNPSSKQTFRRTTSKSTKRSKSTGKSTKRSKSTKSTKRSTSSKLRRRTKRVKI